MSASHLPGSEAVLTAQPPIPPRIPLQRFPPLPAFGEGAFGCHSAFPIQCFGRGFLVRPDARIHQVRHQALVQPRNLRILPR